MTTLDPMPPKRQNQKPRVFLSEKEKKKGFMINNDLDIVNLLIVHLSNIWK